MDRRWLWSPCQYYRFRKPQLELFKSLYMAIESEKSTSTVAISWKICKPYTNMVLCLWIRSRCTLSDGHRYESIMHYSEFIMLYSRYIGICCLSMVPMGILLEWRDEREDDMHDSELIITCVRVFATGSPHLVIHQRDGNYLSFM